MKMNSTSTQACGFAVRCDLDGQVREVLRADADLPKPIKGRPILDIIDAASQERACSFFQTLLARQAAFGCEVNVHEGDVVESVHLAGVQIGEDMIVIGARTLSDVAAFCEQFFAINSDHVNELRSLYKQRAQSSSEQSEHELFHELSRVNNDLATVQREVAKERSALEKLNGMLAERSADLDALSRVTSRLLGTLDVEVLVDITLAGAMELSRGIEACLMLHDEEGTVLQCANLGCSSATPEQCKELTAQLPRDQGIAVITKDDRSIMAARLAFKKKALGTLIVRAPQGVPFDEDQLKLVQSFAATASAALSNAYLHREAQHSAVTDALTGLYNRRGFFELAERKFVRSVHDGEPLTAVMLDIDHFKQCNDQHGHAVGDQVIAVVAKRCAETLRPDDIIGRYGGEEFALLLSRCSEENGMVMAERIRSAFQTPISTDAGDLPVTISAGVASTRGEHAPTALSELLDRADAALYEAKDSGRNRVKHWTD